MADAQLDQAIRIAGALVGGGLALAGGAAGAAIGAVSARDRWTTVTGEPPRVSLHLTPGRKSFAVGLSVTF